jgi:squalene-associated FAD-dependent desaturase
VGRHVVVVGGGLAGITASIALREAGFEVTLLEARQRLGGAASSYRRGDLVIDNGQHVFLRCCTSYRELLSRLGVAGSVTVQERFDVTVLSPDGQARLRRTGLPAPLHLGRALVGYRLLTLPQRLAIGRAALAMRTLDPASPEVDGQALGEWLAARGQGERARRLLWDLFIVSALNIAGDDASLALAATVIKTALLGARDAADIGIASVPLGDLHDRAAAGVLAGLGVRVWLGAKVTSVQRSADGGFVVSSAPYRSDGHPPEPPPYRSGGHPASRGTPPNPRWPEPPLLTADGVVLAVPAEHAARLAVPTGMAGTARWAKIGVSPIVNVHFVYDRQVTTLPFAAAVDSPVQWVFDKTRQAGLPEGQYLAVSLSAADDYIDIPVAEMRERFQPALEQLFPLAARARIIDFFVTRERRATFRQVPGVGALRPSARTSEPGLVLAGAWTDTGWPDTMEGAVRSGHNAANELIGQLGDGQVRIVGGPTMASSGAAS